MKTYFILILLLVVGCASGKIKDSEILPIKDNTAEINALKDSIFEIKTTLQAKAEIDTKAVAGVDKSQNTKTNLSAGGDITQNNDTEMIKELIRKNEEAASKLNNIFKAIIIAILTQMIILIKWQGNMFNKLLEAKQLHIKNLTESNSKKEMKIDEWQMKMIEKQIDKNL